MKLTKLVSISALTLAAMSAFAGGGGNPQLISDLQKLESDLKSDLAGSQVTTQEWQALGTAINNIVAVAHKPSQQSVEILEQDIKAARSNGTITAAERKQILIAFLNVTASAGIPQSDLTALANACLAIEASSNITSQEVQVLVSDILAIVNDLPNVNP
jgi:phosphoserine aminotransferase